MAIELPGDVRFGREICGDLAQAERREWWLANGLGAYAAGTIAGTLTRRYHGLLIAPVQPPLGRLLLCAKADATLIDDDREWPLFSNRWASGVVAPQGHTHIETFLLDGRMPVWRFAFGDTRLEMRVWMEPGANTTYVAYRLEADHARRLRIKLLVNARDHHGTMPAGAFRPAIETDGGPSRLTLHSAGLGSNYSLHFQVPGGSIVPQNTWIENFHLPVEDERGLPASDNHLCVGEATLELPPNHWTGIVVSLDDDASADLSAAMRRFLARDAGLLSAAMKRVPELRSAPSWVRQLVLAADGFIFARPLSDEPDGKSVIAGYPWFGDWGRDTMIALSGLTLATGRYEDARRIFETFARFVNRGMLPNVFPGSGETPEYNTADAALWYVEAWRAYLEAKGDVDALRQVWPVLEEIVVRHRDGTRHNIAMDPDDALLRAGEPGVQLTWMDAKVGDWVVTPRIGKPVEINALWFNAASSMADFADRLGHAGTPYPALAEKIRSGFQRFILSDGGGLYDVLDGPGGHDASLRPNQIFAVSLPHSPLDRAAQAAVVRACGRDLLCSYGLRSLAPSHPDFHPSYGGGVWERDGGYHQGPVWAWLLGHFAMAEYRVTGDAAAAQGRLEPIRDHLNDAALGSVSEIFDGNPPHTPRGAPSQAWSVACTLEAWWRLERAKPRAISVEETREKPAAHFRAGEPERMVGWPA